MHTDRHIHSYILQSTIVPEEVINSNWQKIPPTTLKQLLIYKSILKPNSSYENHQQYLWIVKFSLQDGATSSFQSTLVENLEQKLTV